MHRSRWRLGSLGLTIFLAAACGATASPAPSTGGGTASAGASAAPTQNAEAIIADLATKAKAEGALNSYGMPPDWTNFGEIWNAFLPKYGPAAGTPLTHTDTDMSSAEEIQKFDAEKNNPVADQGDIGIQFGPVAVTSGTVQPYKPTRWDKIPDYAKDPDGNWMCWYTGTISFAVNTALVKNVPRTWADLLKPEYKGQVAISDPRNSGQGAMTVLAATFANGGSEKDLTAGFTYFDNLNKAGNFTAVAPSKANVEKGEAPIAILWDYNALPMRDDLATKSPAVPIEVVIPSDGTTQAPYCHIINKYAAHPNAAKLFREYILTDEVQILQAKKYARPLVQGVVLPADVAAKFPPDSAYAAVKPITDWKAAADAVAKLATDWVIEVGT
ncbi:MAG: putative spermidine/putrescine transport system substrate-binding protein [Chloroflexota bacterium]|jgi:putative spermidine/putrescine transport system substrate-binding protein|nr:putative spermidine/putrescine transport system substrate-binding protein [Chloroflexota bacterium]